MWLRWAAAALWLTDCRCAWLLAAIQSTVYRPKHGTYYVVWLTKQLVYTYSRSAAVAVAGVQMLMLVIANFMHCWAHHWATYIHAYRPISLSPPVCLSVCLSVTVVVSVWVRSCVCEIHARDARQLPNCLFSAAATATSQREHSLYSTHTDEAYH